MSRVLAAVFALWCAVAGPAAAAVSAPQAAPATGEAVIGLSVRGAHRAYPAAIFAAQRVVNDVISGMEVAVFHDPERGLSTAWFRTVLGEPIEFSGAAVGSVADDLTTVTRWDLETGVAVNGNLQGQRLVQLGATVTTWGGWIAAHPGAQLYRESR